MKIFNLAVKKHADGAKHLDLHIHGVIDGGWETEDQDSAHVADLIAKLSEHRDASTVHTYVNSVGGSVFAGIALYNALEQHPGEVTSFVTGLAASAASLIAMAGKTVMCPGSMMMIHPPSGGVFGTASELRKAADTLDKVQDSLASLYQKKTGKSLEEINALLDDETWMTAEEAVAHGFANETGDAGHHEPDGDEDKDGNEPAGPEEPTAIGDLVVWNNAAFPRSSLPAQIIAMADARRVPTRAVAAGTTAATPAPASSPAPAPAPLAVIVNRAYLAEREPALLAALLAEGHAAGVAAERARLKDIDDLALTGDLVNAAKYGDKPGTAAELAIAVVKSGKHVASDLLAQRRTESTPLARVAPSIPDATVTAEEARVVSAIAAGGNAMRGGAVR